MVIFPKLTSVARVPLVQPSIIWSFTTRPCGVPPHPSSLLALVDLTASPTVKTTLRVLLEFILLGLFPF